MSFPLVLVFRGRFDRNALEDAFAEACRVHPLFACTISPEGKHWIPAKEPTAIVWDEEESDAFPWEDRTIDITREPGLKTVVRQQGDETRIHFLLHHCVSDGMGYVSFLDTLFLCYCDKIGKAVTKKIYDAEKLKARDRFELEPPPVAIPWYRILYSTILETVRWMRSRPLPLVSVNRNESGTGTNSKSSRKTDLWERNIGGETVLSQTNQWGNSGFIFAELNSDTTARVLVDCKKQKQTLGVRLLSTMFLSLADSGRFVAVSKNNRDRPLNENDLLRIGLVCNMRGRRTEDLPACNAISYVFPSRKTGDCRPTTDFDNGIAEELYIIKNWHVGMMFLNGLNFFGRIPGMLKRIIRNDRCLASAMLSSLNRLDMLFSGDLKRDEEGRLQIGDATLFDFQQAAPCRKGTNLSVTTFTYGNSLRFHVRYDMQAIAPEDAADWLDAWIEKVLCFKYPETDVRKP